MPPGDGSRDPGITMWGATSTGKTTFLAALSIALMRQKAQWRVGGTDQASVDRLTELTTRLTADRLFPSATQGVEHYNWELIGTVRRAGQRRWRWLTPTYYDESVRIPLHLIDAPGEAADRSKARGNSVLWDGLLGNMVDSRGIVFFYDPVREFTNGDAFTHTVGVLNELSQRMRSAVCGWKKCTGALVTSAVSWRSGVRSSRIQRPRPNVAATRSSPWMANPRTDAGGRFRFNDCQ